MPSDGPWILEDTNGAKVLVPAGSGAAQIPRFGVVDRVRLAAQDFGSDLELAGKRFRVWRPDITDILATAERKAQVVHLKDSAHLIANCGIRAGSRVAESGLGSGFLTMAMAMAVGPQGHITVFEINRELAQAGVRNLERTGLAGRVDVRWEDVRTGLGSLSGLDAVVLDVPDPHAAAEGARKALVPGGRIGCYLPTMNQVEALVRTLAEQSFRDVRTVELMERELVVGPQGTRPSFDMLAHTGYLTYARSPGPLK